MVVILQRTPLGRYIYAIGNREAAAYLSGVNTRRVTVICFVLCGLLPRSPACCSPAIPPRPTRAWATPICCPRSRRWCIGGTNILGGRGRYLGTLVGVILIVLLNSVLSIMQMPEAGRQVIYGVVIILMLLVYGRGER